MQNKITLKIKGHIDRKWNNWFDNLEISYDANNTLICGYVEDDSQLYGLINKLRDLNLTLLSLKNKIESNK